MSDPNKKIRPQIQNSPSRRWQPKDLNQQDPKQSKETSAPKTENPAPDKPRQPDISIEDEDFTAPTAEVPSEGRSIESPGGPPDQKPL
jgi:hypothetical protein